MSAQNLSVEEAQSRILDGLGPLGAEQLDVGSVAGRVLAQDLVAGRQVPPEDNSAMDGYALGVRDGSRAESGEVLDVEVAGEIPAGGRPGEPLVPGQAARIFTGAPLPPGADRVVLQEWTERSAVGRVRVLRCGPAGDNVRLAGEDVHRGQVLAPAGSVLSPVTAALAAAQGWPEVWVARRPRVGIVSTGDEVHEPGTDLPEGHIYCGNSVGLQALVAEAGGEPQFLGIARDNEASLREVLGRATGCDALITIGGVSVGDYDSVKEVVAEMGGSQEFWKVRMRPGKPNAWGQLGGTPWFGLPGNPVSCMVSFLQFVRPALRAMQGANDRFLPVVTARLDEDLKTREGFLFFLRGILRFDEESGFYRVRTTGPQGSGILSSLSRANALILVPEDRDQVAAGETLRVQLLPWMWPTAAEAGLR